VVFVEVFSLELIRFSIGDDVVFSVLLITLPTLFWNVFLFFFYRLHNVLLIWLQHINV